MSQPIMQPTEIRQHRANLNLTHARLAELTGVTIRTIQAYQAGEYEPSKTWFILFKKIIKESEIIE